ncbi:hypothetical protein M413DRAFT_448183 [Hebeloma cylindrosporum]|uniref:Uncharacterized protein n=1 Tax=Hebeloma cylindrosporum TaxID=76867 RepID=A0A0C2YA57_HEBCY|nr:hypothetical protein M413DRAFT_448183 [Hebeloma cylindrosporum h7]
MQNRDSRVLDCFAPANSSVQKAGVETSDLPVQLQVPWTLEKQQNTGGEPILVIYRHPSSCVGVQVGSSSNGGGRLVGFPQYVLMGG